MALTREMNPRPNRERYIRTLRTMSPEQRLMKAIELSELSRSLMRHGLRERHPAASDAELRSMYLEQLEQCRNRSY